MIARFDGRDYMLILEKNLKDFREIDLNRRPLDAVLVKMYGDETCGKIIRLVFAENTGMDGIDVSYHPERPDNWEAIQEIIVSINDNALLRLIADRRAGTRYNGFDTIEIFNGDPAEL